MQNLNSLETKYGSKKKGHEALKAEVKEALTCIFKEVPSIDIILMYGSTPSFNDGDPCVHNQYVAVQEYDYNDVYISVIGGGFGEDDDEEEEKHIRESFEKEHGVKLPLSTNLYWRLEKGATVEQQQHVRVGQLLNNMKYLFHGAYDTNWKLTITRTGEDTFDIKKGRYDCGY